MKHKFTFWQWFVMGIIGLGFIDAGVLIYLATLH